MTGGGRLSSVPPPPPRASSLPARDTKNNSTGCPKNIGHVCILQQYSSFGSRLFSWNCLSSETPFFPRNRCFSSFLLQGTFSSPCQPLVTSYYSFFFYANLLTFLSRLIWGTDPGTNFCLMNGGRKRGNRRLLSFRANYFLSGASLFVPPRKRKIPGS